MIRINVTRKRAQLLGTLTVLLAILAHYPAFSQVPAPTQAPPVKEDFEENDLNRFLNASQRINVIQMEAQGEMMEIIEKEGLSVDEFNTLAQAQQNPNSTPTTSPDPKTVESFQNAATKINEMQQGLEGEMVKAVEEEGLEVDTYMQIVQAYQQSPKVKENLDRMMKEKQAEEAAAEQR